MQQAQVAFLDEVQKRQPAVQVAARNPHHEPEVGLDQLPLGIGVALLHPPRELLLLLRGEQRHLGDVAEIEAQQLAAARRG